MLAVVTDIDTTLAALADPTRRRIVELLQAGPRRAGDLAAQFDVTGPAISRHLRVLRRSGLVTERGTEDDARVRIYHLRPEPLVGLRAWVDQVQAFWTEQLDSFRSFLEDS